MAIKKKRKLIKKAPTKAKGYESREKKRNSGTFGKKRKTRNA